MTTDQELELLRSITEDLAKKIDDLEQRCRSMYRTLTWLRQGWPNDMHSPSSWPGYDPKVPFEAPVETWQDERYREENTMR